MTSARNKLIEDYLHRLDNASVFLAPDRRTELRDEIREHISAAMDEVELLDADAVREILERLGPPAEIVAAEHGPKSTGSTPVVTPGRLADAEGQRTEEPPGVAAAGEPAGNELGAAPARPKDPKPGRRPGNRALLIGAAVAAVVAVLALGVFVFAGSSSGPAPAVPSSTVPSTTDPTPTPTGEASQVPEKTPGTGGGPGDAVTTSRPPS